MSKLYQGDEIKQLLPHRDPFLLVDKVIVLEEGKKGIGFRKVSKDEYYFKGHFPNNPVLPGVLQIEIMAQTVGVVVLSAIKDLTSDFRVYLTSVEKAKFRKIVVPDCELEVYVEVIKEKHGIYILRGKCMINGEDVSEAKFTATLRKA